MTLEDLVRDRGRTHPAPPRPHRREAEGPGTAGRSLRPSSLPGRLRIEVRLELDLLSRHEAVARDREPSAASPPALDREGPPFAGEQAPERLGCAGPFTARNAS